MDCNCGAVALPPRAPGIRTPSGLPWIVTAPSAAAAPPPARAIRPAGRVRQTAAAGGARALLPSGGAGPRRAAHAVPRNPRRIACGLHPGRPAVRARQPCPRRPRRNLPALPSPPWRAPPRAAPAAPPAKPACPDGRRATHAPGSHQYINNSSWNSLGIHGG